MVRNIRAPAFRAAATATPQLVIILPLLPVSEAKRFAACAAGNFDARYREIGSALAASGAGNAVLRLGWEANIGSRSHPWGYDTAADAQGYVRCFRRAAGVLKLAARGVKIEWSNAKAGKPPFSVLNANPGDDVVDLWGLHYYDANAQFRTQRLGHVLRADPLGGPQGFGPGSRRPGAGKKLGRAGVGSVEPANLGGGGRQPALHPEHVQDVQGQRCDDRLRELLQLPARSPPPPGHAVPEGQRALPQALVRGEVTRRRGHID
jgi:hypothetical protein